MKTAGQELATKAQKIKLLVLDVDGVLTSGQIAIGRDGEAYKEFNAQDGMGIALARLNGLKTAIITGRESEMVRIRGAELKIADVYQGSMNKSAALAELLAKYSLHLNEICYVGDDLNDLPVMLQAGLSCAVANAVDEVKQHAHFITEREGGRGAVREVIELILKAQNIWPDIVASYSKPGQLEIAQ